MNRSPSPIPSELPPDRARLLRWALLLHDTGKADTRARGEDGDFTFYMHDQVSARIARQVLRRLRASRAEITAVERLVFPRRPGRDADEIEFLMKPARMRCGPVAFRDAFHVCLRRSRQQYAHRMILWRCPRPKKLIVHDLADVGHIVRELATDGNQRRRHDQLRQRQTVGGLNLRADVGVRRRESLVTLTEMHSAGAGNVVSRAKRQPKSSDDEIVIGCVVLVKVVHVDKVGVRGSPGEGLALRDEAHAMPARDQCVGMRELHADAARQFRVFHQVRDFEAFGHQRFCATT